MKAPSKRWIATVHYKCDRLGQLDVDYGVDDLEAVHLLITNGPGYAAVTFIEVNLNPHHPDVVISLETLARSPEKVEARKELDEQ